MDYTLAGIRNRVLDDKLDDTDFDPSIVDRFINDTQRSIFNTYELPFQEKVFDGVLPVGGTIFTFPSDYQLQQSFVIVDPDNNKHDITRNYMEFRDFNRRFPVPATVEAGVPSAWTLHGGKLLLNRPTDVVYTLRLFYLKTPDLLSDDLHVPELPEEFAEILVLGAYYRVLQRNEDFDQAAFIKNGEYADEVDKLVARYGSRQTGTPMVMGAPLRMASRRR